MEYENHYINMFSAALKQNTTLRQQTMLTIRKTKSPDVFQTRGRGTKNIFKQIKMCIIVILRMYFSDDM